MVEFVDRLSGQGSNLAERPVAEPQSDGGLGTAINAVSLGLQAVQQKNSDSIGKVKYQAQLQAGHLLNQFDAQIQEVNAAENLTDTERLTRRMQLQSSYISAYPSLRFEFTKGVKDTYGTSFIEEYQEYQDIGGAIDQRQAQQERKQGYLQDALTDPYAIIKYKKNESGVLEVDFDGTEQARLNLNVVGSELAINGKLAEVSINNHLSDKLNIVNEVIGGGEIPKDLPGGKNIKRIAEVVQEVRNLPIGSASPALLQEGFTLINNLKTSIMTNAQSIPLRMGVTLDPEELKNIETTVDTYLKPYLSLFKVSESNNAVGIMKGLNELRKEQATANIYKIAPEIQVIGAIGEVTSSLDEESRQQVNTHLLKATALIPQDGTFSDAKSFYRITAGQAGVGAMQMEPMSLQDLTDANKRTASMFAAYTKEFNNSGFKNDKAEHTTYNNAFKTSLNQISGNADDISKYLNEKFLAPQAGENLANLAESKHLTPEEKIETERGLNRSMNTLRSVISNRMEDGYKFFKDPASGVLWMEQPTRSNVGTFTAPSVFAPTTAMQNLSSDETKEVFASPKNTLLEYMNNYEMLRRVYAKFRGDGNTPQDINLEILFPEKIEQKAMPVKSSGSRMINEATTQITPNTKVVKYLLDRRFSESLPPSIVTEKSNVTSATPTNLNLPELDKVPTKSQEDQLGNLIESLGLSDNKLTDEDRQQFNNLIGSIVERDSNNIVREVVEVEEGSRNTKYKDSRGFNTIGIGFNLDKQGAKKVWDNLGLSISFEEAKSGKSITEEDTNKLFNYEIKEAKAQASELLSNYDSLSDNRKAVVASMIYQLGPTGFKKFKNTIKAIENEDWETASKEMLDSQWFKQTPARALRAAQMIKEDIDIKSAEASLADSIEAGQKKFI